MTKAIIEIEFDFDGFDELSEKEKKEAIKTVLESGAESTNTELEVLKIKLKDE